MARTLTTYEAREFYDHFGDKQDKQGWYEDKPLELMCQQAALETANDVFEFGCGTGRLAKAILSHNLPATANYMGLDISPKMVSLSKSKLSEFSGRARVELSKGGVTLPVQAATQDRVISCYVLDLLSDSNIELFLTEAHRILRPGALLCTTGITHGDSIFSSAVSGAWSLVHHLNPKMVGGCRPINLENRIPKTDWDIKYHKVVTAGGIPSEVLIAERRK